MAKEKKAEEEKGVEGKELAVPVAVTPPNIQNSWNESMRWITKWNSLRVSSGNDRERR